MVPGAATAKTYESKFGTPSTAPVALDTMVTTAVVVTDAHIVFGNDIERGAKFDNNETSSCWANFSCLNSLR